MTLNLSHNACMTLNLTLNYTKFSSLPLLHALILTSSPSAEHDYQLRTTISAAMSCASPISQTSPTLHMLTANLVAANCRPNLDDQGLILHNNTFSFAFTTPPTPHLPSSLSSSPAQLRPALTDLLHAKHINSSQSALNKGAVNLPCSPSFESPRKGCKENRININGGGEDNGGSITSVASSAGVSPSLKRKRPAKLAIPECARLASFGRQKEFELPEQETYSSEIHSYEVPLFGVSSKKGRRNCMEDAQTATTDFQGKPNQAFFGVFDGHGGKDAAKFAAENLGHSVAMAIQNQKGGKESLETAMHAGYMALDSEFLAKNVSSGACSVSAFVREGQLVVANAGDCKAVLCRDGKAEALTTLHRASNAEERERIENLGGYVDCFNGVWRLQGTLAVTRGFGDMNLKQWVSAEPEVRQLDITHDCEFLILATDGLWDTVSDQEAVDCAREVLHDLIDKEKCLDPSTARPCKAQKHHHSSFPSDQNNEDNQESSSSKTNACNKLIHKACKRGNLDDITVMIVLLQGFSIA